MKVKDIFFSWDFIISFIITICMFMIIPTYIRAEFAQNVYSIAITILSIIFSVFFAALAIIISTSEDDFVKFLELDGTYSAIIDTFKFTLIFIFFSLILSIILYLITGYYLDTPDIKQHKCVIIVFSFFFFYSLFAVFNSTLDSITYSKKRAIYIRLKS